MTFLDLKGKKRSKNITKRKIDWEGPSRSKFQKTVKDFFYPYWKYDLVFEEMPLVGTRLSLDLVNYSKKIAVEVQGAQHGKFIGYFHKTRNDFRKQLERDNKKETWCEINGYTLIEIYPTDLKDLSKKWILENFKIQL